MNLTKTHSAIPSMVLFWLFLCASGIAAEAAETTQLGQRQVLADGWH